MTFSRYARWIVKADPPASDRRRSRDGTGFEDERELPDVQVEPRR